MLIIGFLSLNAFSQVEPSQNQGGGEPLCFDPDACNYIGDDVLLPPGIVGGEICIYPEWYIPVSDDLGLPAVQSCEPLEGYLLADQCCAAGVVFSDTYCINFDWDGICQATYDSCVSEPDGCNDPAACNYNFSAFCADNSTCEYQNWYIPLTLGTALPVQACEAPDDYVLAVECALLTVMSADSWCITINWDLTCQNDYDAQLETPSVTGCTDPSFCNYDPLACVDDGYCWGVSGCTEPFSCNYNSDASCDDGSCIESTCSDPDASNYDPFSTCDFFGICEYECVGDLDGNGSVTSADLTLFLSNFGNNCSEIILK